MFSNQYLSRRYFSRRLSSYLVLPDEHRSSYFYQRQDPPLLYFLLLHHSIPLSLLTYFTHFQLQARAHRAVLAMAFGVSLLANVLLCLINGSY